MTDKQTPGLPIELALQIDVFFASTFVGPTGSRWLIKAESKGSPVEMWGSWNQWVTPWAVTPGVNVPGLFEAEQQWVDCCISSIRELCSE